VQLIATHLPPEEIEGIRQMFVDMDTDGSGTICFEEFSKGKPEHCVFICPRLEGHTYDWLLQLTGIILI
jgi:hypothetical protein